MGSQKVNQEEPEREVQRGGGRRTFGAAAAGLLRGQWEDGHLGEKADRAAEDPGPARAQRQGQQRMLMKRWPEE